MMALAKVRIVTMTEPLSWGESGGLLYRSPTGESLTREQWLELARDRTKVPVVLVRFDSDTGERLQARGSWVGVASSREREPCFWFLEVSPVVKTADSDARSWYQWLPSLASLRELIEASLQEDGALIVKDMTESGISLF